MKKYRLSLFLLFLGTVALGQQKKTTVAFIYDDYVFENFEGVKRVNAEIAERQEFYQNEFNKIALEYQNSNLDYQNSLKNITTETTESINEKLKKVQQLKESAENYQREAEKGMQELIGRHSTEINTKIRVAAEKVAKTRGFAYVFTKNKNDNPMNPGRILLYALDNKAVNISDDVLKILNQEEAASVKAKK